MFFAIYEVEGFSMRPNFKNNEVLLFYPNYYEDKEINYGDVVILNFKDKEGEFLKRIVGLPNDIIKIENGNLYKNGLQVTSQNEIEMNVYLENLSPKISYKVLNTEKNESYYDYKSIVVPNNNFFVLGDNRQKSGDSRDYGTVHMRQILHKLVPKNHPLYNFSFLF